MFLHITVPVDHYLGATAFSDWLRKQGHVVTITMDNTPMTIEEMEGDEELSCKAHLEADYLICLRTGQWVP